MKLYIDTTNSEIIKIKLNEKEFESVGRVEKSQRLLPFLVETLEKENKKFEDIKEIEVNTSPGSFTGIRVGLAVANTLGWFLKIKVKTIA